MHHRDRSDYPLRHRSRSPHSRYSPPTHSGPSSHRYDERHGGNDRYGNRPPYGHRSRDDQGRQYDRWDEGRDSLRDDSRYDDQYRHEDVGLLSKQIPLIYIHLTQSNHILAV
jgi:hypothetical protein